MILGMSSTFLTNLETEGLVRGGVIEERREAKAKAFSYC